MSNKSNDSHDDGDGSGSNGIMNQNSKSRNVAAAEKITETGIAVRCSNNFQCAQEDLVRGEAPESDEETMGLDSAHKVLAFEVSGEATESDEDEDVYKKSASEETESKTHIGTQNKNNLLQQKLIENNIAIWNNLTAIIKELVISASKQLIYADQLLIKSQVSMQYALSSLKLAEGNMKQLHEKTNDVFTTHFIPNIRIKNQ